MGDGAMKTAAVKLNLEGVLSHRLDNVCIKLESLGITPCFFDKEYSGSEYKTYDEQTLLDVCDIVIALGGDGTILHAARLAALANKPVLGINNGTLGFMAGLEADELDLLDRLKTGDYITDRRMMLEINVKSSDVSHKYYCLNDAVIARGDMSRIIDCSVSFGAKTEMEYRCDGIIVATPTGSTAYSLSAGGPVLDPSINSILITPVCAHSFYARPLVLSPDITVSVQTSTKSGGKAVLTVDGELGVELKSDDIVEISRSDDYCATLIKLKNESFMDVLYNKMIDRK